MFAFVKRPWLRYQQVDMNSVDSCIRNICILNKFVVMRLKSIFLLCFVIVFLSIFRVGIVVLAHILYIYLCFIAISFGKSTFCDRLLKCIIGVGSLLFLLGLVCDVCFFCQSVELCCHFV